MESRTVHKGGSAEIVEKKSRFIGEVFPVEHEATLRDGGFLTMDEDHFLHLTDVGREVAERTYERHCFFTEQLIAAGVDPKTAEADACRIEHIISDESFDRLKEAAAQKQE